MTIIIMTMMNLLSGIIGIKTEGSKSKKKRAFTHRLTSQLCDGLVRARRRNKDFYWQSQITDLFKSDVKKVVVSDKVPCNNGEKTIITL